MVQKKVNSWTSVFDVILYYVMLLVKYKYLEV